jgi:hypothetical protein
VVGLFDPVYAPVPIPDQPVKLKPLSGVAEIETLCPLPNQLLGGVTLPPVPAFIVRKYCVLKFAV